MATSDVFGSLNKFLDKEDDSFKYDLTDYTPDSSFSQSATQKSNNSFVDLSGIDYTVPRTSGRKAKKRGSNPTTPEPDESFDLTNGFIETSPRKRSRRAADEFAAKVIDTIELGETPEMNNISQVKRRGRPSKKAATPKVPKPKKLTYKQSLALVSAKVPAQQVKATAPQPAPRPQPQVPIVESCDVDLTGDIVLTNKHSSAPLFQKSSPTKKKVVEVERVEKSSDEEDLLDFDVDEIKVRVKTESGTKQFSFRKHQRYYDLFKAISEQEGVPIGNIFLYDNDKRIEPTDTPNSTNYKFPTVLICRLMKCKTGEYDVSKKKDTIELKFQSDKWKKPIAVKISKFDSLKTAIDNLCEQMPAFKPDQFSLQFDGDNVSVNDTPTDLEFEGGEILDCRVKA